MANMPAENLPPNTARSSVVAVIDGRNRSIYTAAMRAFTNPERNPNVNLYLYATEDEHLVLLATSHQKSDEKANDLWFAVNDDKTAVLVEQPPMILKFDELRRTAPQEFISLENWCLVEAAMPAFEQKLGDVSGYMIHVKKRHAAAVVLFRSAGKKPDAKGHVPSAPVFEVTLDPDNMTITKANFAR